MAHLANGVSVLLNESTCVAINTSFPNQNIWTSNQHIKIPSLHLITKVFWEEISLKKILCSPKVQCSMFIFKINWSVYNVDQQLATC